MRKTAQREKLIVTTLTLILAGIFAAMIALGLGGCAEESEDPLPQEAPTEELWSGSAGTSSVALMADEGPVTPMVEHLTSAGYDRDKARWYIQQYAKGPNPNFEYCGDWVRHGTTWEKDAADCTNFASQVLQHAGIAMVKTGREDAGWWSNGGCRSSSSSKSWRQVNGLVNYLISEGRIGQVTRNTSDMRLGDVIFYQLRKKEDGYTCPQAVVFNHTSVVSGFDSRGEPLVSYHSNDALDVPWRAMNGSLGSLGNACRYLLVHIR